MSLFSERLKEIMEDNGVDAKTLAKDLNSFPSTVCNLLSAEKGVSLYGKLN